MVIQTIAYVLKIIGLWAAVWFVQGNWHKNNTDSQDAVVTSAIVVIILLVKNL